MLTGPGLLVVMSVLASAMPVARMQTPRETQDASSTAQCLHAGNPDFYGLGIRLGIYLQLLCTMVAMFQFDSKANSLLFEYHDTNLILLFAIFVALVKSTPEQTIDAVDSIILLRLLWLIIFCGFSLGHFSHEIKAFRRNSNFITLIGRAPALVFRYTVIAMISVYNAWFWFRGLDAFHARSVDNCSPYVFFFSKLDALGGLRGFYKLTSILLAILPPTWILAYLAFLVAAGAVVSVLTIPLLMIVFPAFIVFGVTAAFLDTLGQQTSSAKSQDASTSTRHDSNDQKREKGRLWQNPSITYFVPWAQATSATTTGSLWELFAGVVSWWNAIRGRELHQKAVSTMETHPERVSIRYKLYLGAILTYFVLAVVGIELTIIWNAVQSSYDIGSTGQLIPFILGVLGAVKVIIRFLSVGQTVPIWCQQD
ncbi:hypothetical protein PFICI_06433 [Pestalotiopsis fici W106-1]|uniref:Uncharacterized protein n=1 Tax=Pestalotiopsis fici (strain W106-1 / CGMCC3.15140) TaxID=1229662 RepID=W3X8B6_PESFW|nr:uncharacterized protein PFICI_06433 [Pestalotiopsis fici W106-1]ETS81431.1 hypothetical protein PFICI_06433 [Pestalotiopsis fici W106-1]